MAFIRPSTWRENSIGVREAVGLEEALAESRHLAVFVEHAIATVGLDLRDDETHGVGPDIDGGEAGSECSGRSARAEAAPTVGVAGKEEAVITS